MTNLPTNTRIVIVDSGLGGLSIYNPLKNDFAHGHITYFADSKAFPYGRWSSNDLIKRLVIIFTTLYDQLKPDLFVLACNTASTVSLVTLRSHIPVPIVGVVPAIKPAVSQSKIKRIGLLATEGTIKSSYIYNLIKTYAPQCKVVLHGSSILAEIAEMKLMGKPVNLNYIKAETQAFFDKQDKPLVDKIVLGCTHYPFLKDELSKVTNLPSSTWVSSAKGVTTQVLRHLKIKKETSSINNIERGDVFISTAPQIPPNLKQCLRGFSFKHMIEDYAIST